MCWIISIVSDSSGGVAENLACGIEGLKHRWPDSVGTILYHDWNLENVVRARQVTPRFLDQVRLMWPEKSVPRRTIAFGHTRYKTSGTHNPHNSQPFKIGHRDFRLEMAFNGNIPNHENIRREHMGQYTFATVGDTETLARFMLHHIEEVLLRPGQRNVRYAIQEGVRKVLDIFPWGYSVIANFEDQVFAFKDSYGIRPLAVGEKNGSSIFSSEDHFFEQAWYNRAWELPPGSLMFSGDEPIIVSAQPAHPDVFEFVYLAKSESHMYGINTSQVRFDMGFSAAQEMQEAHGDWQFDTVVAVPNGANIMRQGVCAALRMSSDGENGLIRKPHADRSFLASEQGDREQIVRDKFIIVPAQIQGKDILLVDDSIVRGTTMKILVDMLLEAWAKSITVLSASPIVHYGDRYGIAMSTNELIGVDHVDTRRLSCPEVEQKLFYNSLNWKQKARLFYPSVDRFLGVFKSRGLSQVHAAYFDGKFIHG